tara:strand:- start:427 stop:1506 length:1080 start_codon:yes stop_codon:yes gene_type:complete
MRSKYKIIHLKTLYIFFITLSLTIFFFSTTKVEGKSFNIDNIEISQPFEINFQKNKVIDDGFRKAFLELISLIVNSSDRKKINEVRLNEIKGMVETFTIKEEKFIDEIYFVNLGVSFNKKKVFNYLEKKNIFPSIPERKRLLFIPIIIDEKTKDLLIFSNNKIFNEWNQSYQTYHLIEYILPTEDLEDLNLIKEKYEFIEKYDFKEIINKYDLKDSIVALIFKDEDKIRILSRIFIKENLILKNQSFSDVNLNNSSQIKEIIDKLKNVYEDHLKDTNQINTSIKLSLDIKVDNAESVKSLSFEKNLNTIDLIYDFFISKIDKDYVYYKIIFNGTPNNFLKVMKENNFKINTKSNPWILE